MKKLNVYTFLKFWELYHFKNFVSCENKTACEKLWDNCHDVGKKRNIILGLQKIKSKLSAYEYLKQKL